MAPATPRSDDGNQAAIVRAEAGPTGASKSPSKKRKIRSVTNGNAIQGTTPIAMVMADQTVSPTNIPRLAPI